MRRRGMTGVLKAVPELNNDDAHILLPSEVFLMYDSVLASIESVGASRAGSKLSLNCVSGHIACRCPRFVIPK